MSALPNYVQLTCRHCNATAVCGPDAVLRRLQAAGKLRRQKEPSPELVTEVLNASASTLRCHECGMSGLIVQPVGDDFDDDMWPDERSCERCGTTIPHERVELFPDVRLCVRCQQKADSGADDSPAEYCPRCGGLMEVGQAGGAGLTRYRMVCRDCGR